MSKFIVAESFTHHIPTGLGYLEGLTQLGHTAYALPTNEHSILHIEDVVDCIVLLGWPSDPNQIIEFKQSNPDTKVVIVCFGWNDVVLQLKDYVSLWVEHTYMHELADKAFEQHGCKLHHIPLGASSDRFYPLQIDQVYDLSFVGQFGQNGHGYRHEDIYLYPLMKKGLSGFYSGFHNYPPIPHHNLNRLYNQTKININFHYWDQKTQTEDPQTRIDFNGRVFEIALSGGFQLCDHPHINSYFGDSIVAASQESWCDVFDYYLNNDDARYKAVVEAQQVALQKHTWKARMNQLINLL